jgi:hypothetical protein
MPRFSAEGGEANEDTTPTYTRRRSTGGRSRGRRCGGRRRGDEQLIPDDVHLDRFYIGHHGGAERLADDHSPRWPVEDRSVGWFVTLHPHGW